MDEPILQPEPQTPATPPEDTMPAHEASSDFALAEPPATETKPIASIGSSNHVSTEPTPAAGNPEDAPVSTHPTVTHGAPGKVTHKGLRIIVILVIALGLAGIAVYFYSKKGLTTTKATPAASTAIVASKSSDVTETISAVDKVIKTSDDNQDLNSADLSNTTLGL